MSSWVRFCINCGSEIVSEDIFCSNCGFRVAASDESGEPKTGTVDLSSLETFVNPPVSSPASDTYYKPGLDAFDKSQQTPTQQIPTYNDSYNNPYNDQTVQMPNIDNAYGQSYGRTPYSNASTAGYGTAGQTTWAPAKAKRQSSFYVMIAIIVAAVAVVAVIVMLWVIPSLTNSNSTNISEEDSSSTVSQPDYSSSDSGSSSNSGSTNSNENYAFYYEDSSGVTQYGDEQELYEMLLEYYDKLDDYDQEIATAATNFNNNYTKESYSERQGYANTVSDLLDRIEDDYDFLSTVTPNASSSNYDSYSNILQCYYDCVNRTDVIDQSWSRSLQYSNPADHVDYIIEPLTSSNDGDGNIYKQEFDELYPNCAPVSP